MTEPRADELWDGRYRLIRRLGAGGMATVWLARDERLGRDVAVKVLSDVLAGDREYITRFEREAQVAAKLSHANLVTVFDYAVTGERPYLVMELVSGGTAATRARGEGFAPAEVERMAEELLAALEHIHRAGVVHRDLKPANVLIDERGRFRLTDFGIAQPSDATSITQTGDVIGTMRYLAPEVRAGERATVRSDLYSLGVLLRDCGGERSPMLAPLLEALAEEDPAARPASAAEAAALLRVATASTRVLPETAGGPERHRSRAILAASALCVLAAIAFALAVGGGGSDEATLTVPETTEQAPEKPRAETQPEQKPVESEEEPTKAPEPQPDATTCAELAEQRKAIAEERKAAEELAADDKETKDAIKADFEAQKKAIEEQQKDCVK